MRLRLTRYFLFFWCFVTITNLLQGQQMWPGDINDNGEANAVDLLYWGYAFGANGPERQADGNGSPILSWAPMSMGEAWETTFPDSTNFAYADINGDGRINSGDFPPMIEFFGQQHQEPTEDMFLAPDTTAGIPSLSFLPTGLETQADGNYLQVEVLLTQGDSLVENFYGIAAQISFSPGTLKPMSVFKPDTEANSWIVQEGERATGLGRIDSINNFMEIGLTRNNHENISGTGRIAKITLPLAEGITLANLDEINLTITRLVMVDAAMQPRGVAAGSGDLTINGSCPLTVDPVCGIDGITYLNGCFAEAAGITHYTAGACYSPGIDVSWMDSTANCDMNYEPVCGFNFTTYSNACQAEAAGVVAYSTGICPINDFSCYDPNLIVISNATSVNTVTGVIEVNCPAAGEAVVGCDGITYPNACIAEAAGIRSYTTAGDDNDCIDPTQIDQDADCGNYIEFVCGCNGETFVNACFAEAAGIQSYTPGPCGGTSNWCAEATPINCGDYLPNESTIGAGNQLTSYPGCTGASMLGPDRVYVLQKTGAGDLQIGLEIMTPGLDLDIFLISGDCNEYICLDGSTTSNTITNNEGIILEDAPIGTYYIVVDQQQAGIGGDYRLEVSCGYLDCSSSVALECGVSYHGTNLYGNDDVSLYTCGNTLNVENNGPEIVHTFTTSESGSVTIDLTGLSANLELFLLSTCDRGACLAYSQNPGTSNEQIVRNLAPGTYYVVVDGYNGAISDYSLTVDCEQDCDLTIVPTGTTDADCGQSNGEYNFSIYGGVATYIATYTGPVSGSQVSQSGHFCFVNLPPGHYTIHAQDGSGCTITGYFEIGDGGDLDLWVSPVSAGCGTDGSLNLTVEGSSPPYAVHLTGEETLTTVANSNSFNISNLSPGTYSVTVTNSSNCSATRTVTIAQTGGNLQAVTTPYPAGCGELGRINVAVQNGILNYTVHLSGPVSGTATVESHNFNLINLPSGAYILTITDALGCTFTEAVVVPSADLDVQVSTTPAACGNPGAALVSMSSGTPPYTINYFGPVSGTVNTPNASIVINGLPTGSYTFSVWDANGCDVSETAYIADEGGDLNVNISQGDGDCSDSTAPVSFNITGGTPAYSINYSGPVNGTETVDATGQTTLNLPAGNYTFIITDFIGCSYAESFTVDAPQSNVNFLAETTSNSCGQLQNITTNIFGGSPPYTVTVSNNCGDPDDTFVVFNTQFTLENLPNCTYQISILDDNGCAGTQSITVNAPDDLDLLTLIPVGGGCFGSGYIDVVINGGDSPYYLNWTGPVSSSVNLVTPTYRVEDLPAGVYTFTVTTTDGCTDEETVTLNNGGNLDLVSTLVFADCGQYDQIWNDITGGTPPYTVEVIRLCDNEIDTTFNTTDDGFELTNLIPCDYKIKVTDANGCMTMNTVTVFPYQLFDAIPTPGLCGQPGQIEINIMNAASQGPYQVVYSGPQSGSFSLDGDNTTLTNLPAGTYTITITDLNGCTETETVVLEDNPSDLDLLTAVIFNDCGQYNQLWNDINGGQPPFTVEVIRLCDNTTDTTFTTSETSFELPDLPPCTYKVKVTDANGCMDMETRTIDPSSVDIFTATPVSGPCGDPGRITINITGGTAPYAFTYTGPQSGGSTINGTSLVLEDLPGGTYTLTITDANGCEETEAVTVVVTSSDITINSALIFNECGQYNQVWNDIIGGTGPFNIQVLRLCDSTNYANFVSNEAFFELYDLPPCEYKIIVVDASGCMNMDTVTVFPSPVAIFEVSSIDGECNELGSFTVNFLAGTPAYTLEYTGPVGDTITLDSMPHTVSDLPSGTYTIIVRDQGGCVQTEQVTITNTTTDLELVTAIIFNDCGQYNQLWNDINGGVPPYDVEVMRLCDNTMDTSFTTSDNFFELMHLSPCSYKVKVTDATGCMVMTTSNITSSSADIVEYTLNENCENPSISLEFIDGSAPYQITLMGPDGELNYPGITESPYDINQLTPGDYMLIAESAEGCSEFAFFSLNAVGPGDPPAVDFEFSQSSGTVTFMNLSDPAQYSWDFGDGTTSNETSPVHDYDAPGSYSVCLTATNGCGSDDLCQDVIVTTGSITLDIEEVSATSGEVVAVPVTITGAENLATLAGSFLITPGSMATITGASPGIINPQFNPGNLSFSYIADDSNGLNLTSGGDETILFYLMVSVNGEEGHADIFFRDQPVAVEFTTIDNGIPVAVAADRGSGRVTVAAVEEFDIEILTEDLNGNPISNVTYNVSALNSGNSQTVVGDANGYANLGNMNEGDMYYLAAQRTGDAENGLSTFGLYIGQRYLLGLPAPQITSPYQIIAADVNCSNSFSTLDLFLIQGLIIGDQQDFGACPNWVFVHESSEMPTNWNASNVFPFVEQGAIQLLSDTITRFTGVKKGDILGAANPNNFNTSSGRSDEPFIIDASLPSVAAGQEVSLLLHVANFADLASLQFQLDFDTDKLEYLGSQLGDALAGAAISEQQVERGAVRLAWFNPTGQGSSLAETNLLEIRFRSQVAIDRWEDLLTINSDAFNSEAYRGNHQRLSPELRVQTSGLPASATIEAAFNVQQNQPNPFQETTVINFQLPTDELVQLTITDALGRVVLERKQAYLAGPNRMQINLAHLSAGVYYYRVQAGEATALLPMIIQR